VYLEAFFSNCSLRIYHVMVTGTHLSSN
jgi:hypothetical protein